MNALRQTTPIGSGSKAAGPEAGPARCKGLYPHAHVLVGLIGQNQPLGRVQHFDVNGVWKRTFARHVVLVGGIDPNYECQNYSQQGCAQSIP